MRERTADERQTFVNQARWGSSVSNPNPAWSTSTSVPVMGLRRFIRDDVTPQFRARVASGEVIVNQLYLQHSNVFSDFNGVYLYKMISGEEWFGDLRGRGFGAADPRKLEAYRLEAEVRSGLLELVTRAQERVATETLAKKGAADYGGSTFAGELRETLAYLRNPFATGLRLASSVERKLSKNLGAPWKPGLLAKRYDLRDSASVPREVANLAAEYMYGLRPLVKEVEEILDRLQNGHKRHTPRERVGAKETLVVPVTWATPIVEAGLSYTANVRALIKVDVKAGALYHFAHSIDAVNRGWGIRLTDLPATAWQLMPLSFVYDWFWGVSSFIKALTPIAGLVTDREWTVLHKTSVVTAYSTNWSLSGDPAWKAKSPAEQPSYLSHKEISRGPAELMPSLTRTRLTDGLVSLKGGQAAGLLALFTQRLEPLVREFAPVFSRRRG